MKFWLASLLLLPRRHVVRIPVLPKCRPQPLNMMLSTDYPPSPPTQLLYEQSCP
ncbi:hypothetical protein LY78DRAFT_664364 [Colletotrichum sublineola]|nr:hypothetical protein LY78DRAFT_664364 [Colletotrichum sublineola]